VGLAEFTAQSMTRGTKSRDAARIAKEVEAVGAELQATSSYEATLLSCKSLSRDMRTCLSVLPDIVMNANFPQSEVDLVRRNLLASIRQRLDDAGKLASAHFQSALWGDEHARGWVMSSGTIEAISRDDLLSWHKAQVIPNNSVLAVSGDFDAKKLRANLERAFGRWRKAEIPPTPAITVPESQGLKIRLVSKPGQTQSHIRIGHLGIAHGDPDFYATLAFNYTLGGGGFSSRLMKVVRSAEGKAYTASSSFDRNREVGAFVAATFTRSAETVATIKLVQGVIAEMASSGPSSEEVVAATTNISGSYAMRFETASNFASALLAADLHGFNDAYVSRYPQSVAAVTPKQAAKAAARVLDTVNGVLVIVGDAETVGPQLAAAGWGFETVAFSEPVSNWERAKPRNSGTESASPKEVAAAVQLLDQALSVKGGAKKLAALKSFHWIGDAVLNLPDQQMAAIVEKHYSAPDKLRLDMVIGEGQVKIVTALKGRAGWALEDSPRGKQVRDFTAPELAALSNQLWQDSELVLLRHQDQGARIRPLGERAVGGKMAVAIGVTRADEHSVTLLIDAKSKLLLGMDYANQGMKTSERFSNYRKVSGLQVAHTRTTKGPQVDLTVKLSKFEVGRPVPTTLFTKPTAASPPAN
ncbi:MAG: insulinase family protein, partial [Myxococcales bacterium]|nr:insulinase family protein [Myxococcales bacterium]